MLPVRTPLWAAALLLTAPWLAAADPPPAPPERNVLTCQDVPAGPSEAPHEAQQRWVGSMVDEATCWQVAKILSVSVPTQVFYCVTKPEPAPVDMKLKRVPPLTPKGRMVRL